MATIRLGTGRHRVIIWSGLRIKRAAGAWLEDEQGQQYLDFFGASGVNLVGHSHPHVVENVERAFRSRGIGAFPGQFEDDLVARLGEVLSDAEWNVELFSGGAEAVEAALRAAEEYTGRRGVIAFSGGFHGKTMGSRSITEGASPPVAGVTFAPYADCARCPLSLNWPDCDYACADKVGEIAAVSETPVGAVIIEPVQGRAGNIVPPTGYLARIRGIADDLGLLLIIDETLTCLGRTGKWLAHHAEDLVPDLVVIGKGIGGGYPVSALIGTAAVMDAGSFGVPSGNSSSFGGYAAASAAAAATMTVLREEHLVERSWQLGAVLKSTLEKALENCSAVERISGQGLAIGIHFAGPAHARARRFFDECLSRGLVTMTGEGCSRIYPPLISSDNELWSGAEILCAAALSLTSGASA